MENAREEGEQRRAKEEAREEAKCAADVRRARFAQDCREGDLAGVRKYRGDVDAFVSYDYRLSSTGLDVAARNGNTAVCRALVNEMGADVDKPSEDVESKTNPLRTAVETDNLELVRVFVEELGADLHLTIPYDGDADHEWPMDGVVDYADPGPTLRYLVRKGVDPNTADVGERFGEEDLKSPLIARFSCSKESVRPGRLPKMQEDMGGFGRCCWMEGVEFDYCAPLTVERGSVCADWLLERGFELINSRRAEAVLKEAIEEVSLSDLSTPAYLDYCALLARPDCEED